MKILAIEFSSGERSVALVEGARKLAQNTNASGVISTVSPALANDGSVLARASELGGRHAIGLIGEVFKQAGCGPEDVEAIAVGLGPGSYTGIRGAIALAQGWQIGRGTKLLGISSVECIAAQALQAGTAGTVHIIIDAQRSEFYAATYEIGSASLHETGALRLAGRDEIERLANDGGRVIGPDISRWFPQAININPDAATLGCLALSHGDFTPGESLEPIYLRETTFKKAPPVRHLE